MATGGSGGNTWSWSGNTPPGMELTPAGVIEGTPTTAGHYSFTVMVVDSSGDSYHETFTLTVNDGTISITPTQLSPAAVNQLYTSVQFQASNGTPPYSWSSTINIPGMKFAAGTSGGLLAGTPTTAATYPFTVTVTDSTGVSASENLTLVVAGTPPPILQFTTGTNLPPAALGIPYSLQFNVTGAANSAQVTYQLTAGSLPSVFYLSPSGLLSGTPSEGGSFGFTVLATDPNSGLTVSKAFNLNVTSNVLLFATPANLDQATVGTFYTLTFAVSGSNDPASVTYAIASDSTSPPGLDLSSAGVLSGTPTEAGTFGFTVVATDPATGLTAGQAFNLNVVCNGSSNALQILGKTDFGRLFTGTSISVTYTACGGTPPYASWTPLSSYFGLSFSNCSGPTCTFGGNPEGSLAGTNQFFGSLIVEDSAGAEAKINFAGEIVTPLQLTAGGTIPPQPAFVGIPFTFTGFTAGIAGGKPPYTCAPSGAPSGSGFTFIAVGDDCLVHAENPTQPGTYQFKVQITDSSGSTPVPVTLTVVVNPSAGAPSANPTNQSRSGGPVLASRGLARGQRVSPTDAAGSSTPSINAGGVIDIAAYQSLLTSGGIMSAYGTNLADGIYQATSTPLPVSLGDVEVTVNGENAALFYVSPGQINFQAPTGWVDYYPLTTPCLQNPPDPATLLPVNCSAPGPPTIMVIRSGVPSATVSVPVSTSASAVLTLPGSVGLATHANGQLITQSAPAQAGESIVFYGSGIGYPTCNANTGFPSGSDCLTNVIPQFTFPDYPGLNENVNVLFAGLTPSAVGLAQFNLQMPTAWAAGALANGSIRMRIGDPTTGQTFNLYLPGGTSSASIALSPPSLSFTAQVGGAAPAGQSISVTSSAPTVPLNYTVTASTSAGGGWLSVSPPGGTTPETVSVTANPAGLAAGAYIGAVTIGGATVSVTFTVTASNTVSSSSPTGTILNRDKVGGTQFCLNVPNGWYTEDNTLITWECNSGGNEQFMQTAAGELRIGGLCVDDYGSGQQGGSVGLWPCQGSANQQWTLQADGHYVGDGGLCLAPDASVPGGGTAVIMTACVAGNQSQLWDGPVPQNGATTTTLTSSLNPSALGQNVTLTATVTPSTATGSVTFREGSTVLGMGALNGGTATLNLTTLSVGTHTLVAEYSEDANHVGSVSTILFQTVNQGTTGTIVNRDTVGGTQFCLNVPNGEYSQGTTLITWVCGTDTNELFTQTAAGELTIGGLCVDAYGGGQQGGSVGLSPCQGGTSQQWTLQADGHYVGDGGLCIAPDALAPGMGTGVIMTACVAGNQSQLWSGPPATLADLRKVAFK